MAAWKPAVLYSYPAVLHGQSVTVRRYAASAPRSADAFDPEPAAPTYHSWHGVTVDPTFHEELPTGKVRPRRVVDMSDCEE